MEGYRKSSHAIYRCEYHFVWVPKYRYQILINDVKPRLKDILSELCEWLDITVIEGAICSDHVHMYVSVPPKYSASQVMKVLKGKSAEYLRKEFPEMCKRYWGMHIWARGYFVSTVGIDREVIKTYVKKQVESQVREEQLRIWKDGSG
jgi:putative transposase